MENNFLQELRIQFDRLVDSKSRLDNKAGNMITMSGMISTLLMGFGVFLIRSINSEFSLFFTMFLVLIVGIVLVVITVGFAIRSYMLRDQWYPTGSDLFFTSDQYDWNEINSYINASTDKFNRRMIIDYLDSIRDIENNIEEKGKFLKISQWFFLGGVCSIPILIGLVLFAIYENMLDIKPLF